MLRSIASTSRLARTIPVRSTAIAGSPGLMARFSTSSHRGQASEAPKQPKMIKLHVNGKEVEVEQG